METLSKHILYKGRESKYFWMNVPLLKCKIYWTTLLIFFSILLYYTNNEILTAKKNIGITRLIKFLLRLRKLGWPQCEDSKLRIWVEMEIIKEGEESCIERKCFCCLVWCFFWKCTMILYFNHFYVYINACVFSSMITSALYYREKKQLFCYSFSWIYWCLLAWALSWVRSSMPCQWVL